MSKRIVIAVTAFVSSVLVLLVSEVAAQPYPSRPIRVLVGVPPGGATDLMTRMYAEWLHESLGQAAVVDNRPGANTAAAADALAHSSADGYTLLLSTDALLSIVQLAKLNFDPYKDFAPIGTIGVSHFAMVVHPSLPANTVKELIALAKASPGKLNYASSGNASTSQFGMEKFKMVTGTDIVHIPYKGAGPAITDAIAGEVQISIWTPLAVVGHVKAGKLKALAVTGPKRIEQLPNLPTFGEAGLPQYDHEVWFAMFAPAGTPKPIVYRLNAEIGKMVTSPKVKPRLDSNGVEPLPSTPEALTTRMRNGTAEMAKLIKIANIKAD